VAIQNSNAEQVNRPPQPVLKVGLSVSVIYKVTLTPVLGSPIPVLGYEDETGGERNLIIFEAKPSINHINA